MVDSCSENSSESFNPDFQNGSVPIELMTEHSSQNLSQTQNDTKIGEIMDNVTKAITNSQVYSPLRLFELRFFQGQLAKNGAEVGWAFTLYFTGLTYLHIVRLMKLLRTFLT